MSIGLISLSYLSVFSAVRMGSLFRCSRAQEACTWLEHVADPEAIPHAETLWLAATTWNRCLLRYKAKNHADALRWCNLPLGLLKLKVGARGTISDCSSIRSLRLQQPGKLPLPLLLQLLLPLLLQLLLRRRQLRRVAYPDGLHSRLRGGRSARNEAGCRR